jgi:hypothetical protein
MARTTLELAGVKVVYPKETRIRRSLGFGVTVSPRRSDSKLLFRRGRASPRALFILYSR